MLPSSPWLSERYDGHGLLSDLSSIRTPAWAEESSGQCCRGELDVAGAAQATEHGEQRHRRPPSHIPHSPCADDAGARAAAKPQTPPLRWSDGHLRMITYI